MVTNNSGEGAAAVIHRMMTEQRVTPLGLSEATSIPRTTLIRRLSGKSPFKLNELADVAEALGTTAAAILTAAERAA